MASSPDLYRGHRRPVGAVASTLRTVLISSRGPPARSVANTSDEVAISYSLTSLAVNRVVFNRVAWRPALDTVGVPRGRENGVHALRHFYASVLLDAGENIKALSEYLGHHDPGFTLRTYTHLMPSSEKRTREAVNGAFDIGPDADD